MQSIGQMSTQASHSMHSLSVNTVCTSQLRQRCASFHAGRGVEAELDLHLDVLQRDLRCPPRAPCSARRARSRCRSSTRGCPSSGDSRFTIGGGRSFMSSPLQQLVDRDRGVVAVRHRPDDVLRAERRVAAEEHVRRERLHGDLVERPACPTCRTRCRRRARSRERRSPARPRPARRRTRSAGRARRSGRGCAGPCRRTTALTFSKVMPVSLPFCVHESLRHEVVEDRNALVLRVFLLPGARLHLLEARAHDHLHVLAAEALRGAAAVHGGVAAAQHDHALADLRRCGRRTPTRASRCRCGCSSRASLRPGNVEVAAARRARADEDRVVALAQQLLHASRSSRRP